MSILWKRLALAAAFCCTGLGPARAVTESPNVARGFQPERSFELGEIDHVSGFNGSLIITLGIGQTFVVSPQLSYSFSLTYSSNVWDGDEGSVPETTASYLNRSSNAGLGWLFSIAGRLIQPGQVGNRQNSPIYLAADGNRTVFHSTLVPGASDTDPDIFYSRDGKYMRLRNLGSCAGWPWTGQCTYEVDSGDGLVRRFRQSDGQLVSMTDRFGNAVSISYSANGDTWTVTDGVRTHTVHLVSKQLDTGNFVMMVDSVDLAAFDGATATFDLTYSPTTNLPRATPYNDPNQTSTAPATLLSGVAGPESWSLSAPEYQLDATDGPKLAGTLQKLVLPTGGAIEWDYQMYTFAIDSDAKPFLTGSAGVKERRTRTSAGAVEGTWAYVAEQPGFGKRCLGGSGLPPKTLKRETITPLGHTSRRYFTAWPCATGAPDPDLGEYSLPYDKQTTDSASGAYLSEEIFACDTRNAGCTTPKRKIFVKYERDGSNPQEVGEAMNQRLSYKKVVYVDDGNKYKEATWSSFDGYGHYEQELLGGNFDAGNTHTSFTNFTPQVSPWLLGVYDRIDLTESGDTSRTEYDFNTTTGFLDCVRALKSGTNRGTNDLLTRFTGNAQGFVSQERFYGGDRQTIGTSGACTDGSAVGYTIDHTYQYGARKSSKYAGVTWHVLDLKIDANSGLAASSTDSSGLETTFGYDLLGRLTEQRPVGSASFAADAWTDIAYQFGTQASGTFTSVTVKRCKSSSGSNCSGNNLLSHEFIDYDDFGRVWQEGRRLPDGSFSNRRTLYDGAGNRAQVSTIKTLGSGTFSWTTFSNYDPFGRPASITAPDGKVTSFSREGDRRVETTQKIALSLSDTESNVTRRETFDRQGRLFRVEELSNPAAPSTYVKTDYSYDEAGRLARVCQEPSGSTCGQERLFTYDNRGFLTSEKHPEKGATGNGSVSYRCYDSRGNAGEREDGAASRISAFTFDAAERLTHVRSRASGDPCSSTTGTLWKQFTYDASSATNAGLGKLATAARRNELPAPWSANYQITESYLYGGRMGRASARTTSLAVSGTAAESWSFSTAYHELGLPSSLEYPTCSGSGCTPGSSSPFALDYSYTDGLLSAIPNWTSNSLSRPIDYHPNLLVSTIAHANGSTETIANDPDKIQRPKSISVTALDGNQLSFTAWATGDHLFDGAGNLKAIGADRFAYDRVSRLVGSDLDSSAPGRTQSYTFDRYGNLLTKQTDADPAITFPISSATNRLTSPNSYDAAGNQTSYNGNGYAFDLLNTMTALCTGSANLAACPAGSDLWAYVYTADDERVLALRRAGSAGASNTHETWTLRDLGNRILRRDAWVSGPSTITGSGAGTTCPGTVALYCQSFEAGDYLGWSQINPGDPSQVTDYVWRGDKLFASQNPSGDLQHFALDHLGTIRLVTSDFGNVVAQHAYFPFGEEATDPGQDAEPMKFTGHERDLQSTSSSPADDLDQIHRRFHSPLTGRFLSVDPSDASGSQDDPQSWNRYTSHANNPIKYIDPDGMLIETPFDIAMAIVSIAQAIQAPTPGNIVGAILDVAAVVVPGVPAVGGRAIDAAQVADKVADTVKTAEKVKDGVKAAAKGGESARAKYGREQHELFKDSVKQKEGWDPNPRIKGPDGRELRPDALTRSGRPIELKPNTPSGRRQGRAQLRKYEQATSKRGRVVYYDPPKR